MTTWTVRHWAFALFKAQTVADVEAIATLQYRHHYYADHCGGWEVAAWPCPTAAKVLDDLLVGVA